MQVSKGRSSSKSEAEVKAEQLRQRLLRKHAELVNPIALNESFLGGRWEAPPSRDKVSEAIAKIRNQKKFQPSFSKIYSSIHRSNEHAKVSTTPKTNDDSPIIKEGYTSLPETKRSPLTPTLRVITDLVTNQQNFSTNLQTEKSEMLLSADNHVAASERLPTGKEDLDLPPFSFAIERVDGNHGGEEHSQENPVAFPSLGSIMDETLSTSVSNDPIFQSTLASNIEGVFVNPMVSLLDELESRDESSGEEHNIGVTIVKDISNNERGYLESKNMVAKTEVIHAESPSGFTDARSITKDISNSLVDNEEWRAPSTNLNQGFEGDDRMLNPEIYDDRSMQELHAFSTLSTASSGPVGENLMNPIVDTSTGLKDEVRLCSSVDDRNDIEDKESELSESHAAALRDNTLEKEIQENVNLCEEGHSHFLSLSSLSTPRAGHKINDVSGDPKRLHSFFTTERLQLQRGNQESSDIDAYYLNSESFENDYKRIEECSSENKILTKERESVPEGDNELQSLVQNKVIQEENCLDTEIDAYYFNCDSFERDVPTGNPKPPTGPKRRIARAVAFDVKKPLVVMPQSVPRSPQETFLRKFLGDKIAGNGIFSFVQLVAPRAREAEQSQKESELGPSLEKQPTSLNEIDVYYTRGSFEESDKQEKELEIPQSAQAPQDIPENIPSETIEEEQPVVVKNSIKQDEKCSIKSGFVAISEIDEYYQHQSLDSDDAQEDGGVQLKLINDMVFDREVSVAISDEKRNFNETVSPALTMSTNPSVVTAESNITYELSANSSLLAIQTRSSDAPSATRAIFFYDEKCQSSSDLSKAASNGSAVVSLTNEGNSSGEGNQMPDNMDRVNMTHDSPNKSTSASSFVSASDQVETHGIYCDFTDNESEAIIVPDFSDIEPIDEDGNIVEYLKKFENSSTKLTRDELELNNNSIGMDANFDPGCAFNNMEENHAVSNSYLCEDNQESSFNIGSGVKPDQENRGHADVYKDEAKVDTPHAEDREGGYLETVTEKSKDSDTSRLDVGLMMMSAFNASKKENGSLEDGNTQNLQCESTTQRMVNREPLNDCANDCQESKNIDHEMYDTENACNSNDISDASDIKMMKFEVIESVDEDENIKLFLGKFETAVDKKIETWRDGISCKTLSSNNLDVQESDTYAHDEDREKHLAYYEGDHCPEEIEVTTSNLKSVVFIKSLIAMEKLNLIQDNEDLIESKGYSDSLPRENLKSQSGSFPLDYTNNAMISFHPSAVLECVNHETIFGAELRAEELNCDESRKSMENVSSSWNASVREVCSEVVLVRSKYTNSAKYNVNTITSLDDDEGTSDVMMMKCEIMESVDEDDNIALFLEKIVTKSRSENESVEDSDLPLVKNMDETVNGPADFEQLDSLVKTGYGSRQDCDSLIKERNESVEHLEESTSSVPDGNGKCEVLERSIEEFAAPTIEMESTSRDFCLEGDDSSIFSTSEELKKKTEIAMEGSTSTSQVTASFDVQNVSIGNDEHDKFTPNFMDSETDRQEISFETEDGPFTGDIKSVERSSADKDHNTFCVESLEETKEPVSRGNSVDSMHDGVLNSTYCFQIEEGQEVIEVIANRVDPNLDTSIGKVEILSDFSKIDEPPSSPLCLKEDPIIETQSVDADGSADSGVASVTEAFKRNINEKKSEERIDVMPRKDGIMIFTEIGESSRTPKSGSEARRLLETFGELSLNQNRIATLLPTVENSYFSHLQQFDNCFDASNCLQCAGDTILSNTSLTTVSSASFTTSGQVQRVKDANNTLIKKSVSSDMNKRQAAAFDEIGVLVKHLINDGGNASANVVNVPTENLLGLPSFGDNKGGNDITIPSFDPFEASALMKSESHDFWEGVNQSLQHTKLESRDTLKFGVLEELKIDLLADNYTKNIPTPAASSFKIPFSIEIPEYDDQYTNQDNLSIHEKVSSGTESNKFAVEHLTEGLHEIFTEKVDLSAPQYVRQTAYDEYFEEVGKFVNSLLHTSNIDMTDSQRSALRRYDESLSERKLGFSTQEQEKKSPEEGGSK
jgi:hypothetical protein